MKSLIKVLIVFALQLVVNNISCQVSYYNTTRSGSYPSAIGSNTKAQGDFTFSSGYLSEANIYSTTALGYYCRAVANHAFASGINTYASGTYSTAMGDYTRAYATRSFAMGYWTKANSEACLAMGKFNIGLSGTLFEIGRGSSDADRKNALTVYENGKINFGQTSGGYSEVGFLQINKEGQVMDNEWQSHPLIIAGTNQCLLFGVDSDEDLGYIQAIHINNHKSDIILNPIGGRVGIGTTDIPSGYKLAVDGKIITEEVLVEMSEYWSDYVFKEDYNLLSIADLNKYINMNKHLPDVPTLEDVEKEGLNLGKMDAVLLRKIEELTLYILELNNRIYVLEEENKELKE